MNADDAHFKEIQMAMGRVQYGMLEKGISETDETMVSKLNAIDAIMLEMKAYIENFQ